MKQIHVNDYKYPYVYSMGLTYFLFFNLIRATKLHSKNETNIRKPYIYIYIKNTSHILRLP